MMNNHPSNSIKATEKVGSLLTSSSAVQPTTSKRKVITDDIVDVKRVGSRFGGLAAAVEESLASSVGKDLGHHSATFSVTKDDLAKLANDRSRQALIDLLEKAVPRSEEVLQEEICDKGADDDTVDVENPPEYKEMYVKVHRLVDQIKKDQDNGPFPTHSPQEHEADRRVDMGVNVLTSVLLCSSPEVGIDPREVEHRREIFGTNAIAEKPLDSFFKLCLEAVQDFVLIMLIVLGIITVVVEVTEPGPCGACWAEGAALLLTVLLVVLLTAGIDYAKQFAFRRLSRSLLETNTKSVIRDGKQVTVTDDDIVVGDILSVNSHALASIPADCVLLGPAMDLKMDESTLTGESDPVSKKPGDIILSGTNAVQGSGRMVVIAVGINSVSGKIRARVYDSSDHDEELGDVDSHSPLFTKLDLIAKQIGIAGMVAAIISFVASCIIGLIVNGDSLSEMIKYLTTAITVLAVAVPEGLPLAVTLALAFSSNQMTKDNNLVKHLDACETMGCATTICSDKTGKSTTHYWRRYVFPRQ
jgi:calcium-translocating P-type ATPase